jgi:nucleotide-binding universal stress UspA family protein
MVPVWQRMLVPLDGSPLAEVALSEALTLAKLRASEVILLRVIPPPDDVHGDDEAAGADGERRKAGALQYLKAVCSGPAWRDIRTEVAVEFGRPAETILDFADQHGVERIVMATHGRTGLGRWVFGSIADKVLRAADRTIVLVYAGRPPVDGRRS